MLVVQEALELHLVLLEVTPYFQPLHQLVVVWVLPKEVLVVLAVAEAGLDGRAALAALVLQTKDLLVQLAMV